MWEEIGSTTNSLLLNRRPNWRFMRNPPWRPQRFDRNIEHNLCWRHHKLEGQRPLIPRELQQFVDAEWSVFTKISFGNNDLFCKKKTRSCDERKTE